MSAPDVLPAETAQETRRGWANCFAKEKTEPWHSDFSGVVTMEDGSRYWVNVFKKLDKNRERYVSVHLSPVKAKVPNG
jgi:hypothetical protein